MPVRFLLFSNDSALCAGAVRSYTKNRLVRTLSPSINLFRAAAFSRQMSLFFKYHINGLLQGLWVSIVYAGGDDVFLVGAWNHTLQAALRIQKHLRSYTCGALTISAGIAMFNEHYSIRAAAKQTAALEELLISADADALRISDAMPWRGDSFYLPKPIAASTSPAELSTVERKAVKKLAWIPVSKFDRYTASLHSGTYPLDELDQSFGQAYEQTKASVTDGAAADDILDSIFRGVQVSDSAPIDNDKLILTGRTLISPLSAARVEDFDGDAKDLPLYQECVRPGETIRFRLTLDQSILNRYAHPITKDALLEAIAEFSRFYQDAFLSHFPQGHPVANIPDTPHLILGGGTGFLSKTVGYPYLKDDYAAALFKSRCEDKKRPVHECVTTSPWVDFPTGWDPRAKQSHAMALFTAFHAAALFKSRLRQTKSRHTNVCLLFVGRSSGI